MPSPLNNQQKRDLVLLAKSCYSRLQPEDDFETWRHAEIERAVGKAGLCCSDNMDYAALMAHFHNLMGNTGVALHWQLRAETEPRRNAMAVLHRSLSKNGLTLAYASHLCRDRHKCGLEECSLKQLWHVIFTIGKRGQPRRAANRPSHLSLSTYA